MRPDHRPPEDLAGFLARQEFYKTFGCAHEHRFSVVVERVGRHAIGNPRFLQLALGHSGNGDLRFAKNHEKPQPVIDFVQAARGSPAVFALDQARHIAGGQFALLDGDMHNLVGSRNVARRKNVRRRRLLRRADGQVAARRLQTGIFEIQPGDLRLAAQGIDDLLGFHGPGVAFLREDDPLEAAVCRLHPHQFRLAIHAQVAFAKRVGHGMRHVGVHLFEELFAALDDSDLRAESRVVMRKFHAGRPAAQNNHRTRDAHLREHGVAVPVTALGQSRHRHFFQARTGGQKERLRGPLPC